MGSIKSTLVPFVNDNGASAEIMVCSDDHDAGAPMGSAASHLCLGPGWLTAVHEANCAPPPAMSSTSCRPCWNSTVNPPPTGS